MRGVLAAATISLLVAMDSPAAAQPGPPSDREDGVDWRLLDGIGYGGLGFGLGLLAAWDMEGSDFGPPGAAVALVGATTLAGAVGGWVVGSRAETAAVQGRELGGAHRAAAMGGAVLAGGTVGAVTSILFINSDGEGTPFGNDEQTVALLVGAGAVLGSWYAWSRRDDLTYRGFQAAPALLGRDRYGLQVRVGR